MHALNGQLSIGCQWLSTAAIESTSHWLALAALLNMEFSFQLSLSAAGLVVSSSISFVSFVSSISSVSFVILVIFIFGYRESSWQTPPAERQAVAW